MILYYYCAGAVLLSFLICFFVTRRGIDWLKKLHMGQKILEIGPSWHKAKEGTPTMGGLFFALTSIGISLMLGVAAVVYGNRAGTFTDAICVLVFLILHGLVGFADDYVKFVRHRNKGLTAMQKLVFQFAITAAFLFCMHTLGHTATALKLPFTDAVIELGWFYYPFSLLWIVMLINAVNLTDGLDGLAASSMSVVLVFFAVLTIRLADEVSDASLRILLIGALLGALIAFLCFNRHPAKLFMGDTGSLFLGAALTGLAYWFDEPLILFFCGIIFLWEALSDVLQVGYFKLSGGKRIFKMAPFHHHLEKCGMSENKIVALFTFITLCGCIAASFF